MKGLENIYIRVHTKSLTPPRIKSQMVPTSRSTSRSTPHSLYIRSTNSHVPGTLKFYWTISLHKETDLLKRACALRVRAVEFKDVFSVFCGSDGMDVDVYR